MKHNKQKEKRRPLRSVFSGKNLFFTADTHFGEKYALRFGNRPFDTVEKMNEGLIRRWNETVPKDGTVFHLGDFGKPQWRILNNVANRLNGEIYLILGNHDQDDYHSWMLGRFKNVSCQKEIIVDGQHIILNHSPLLCFGGAYDGTWQLFGHVHSGPDSLRGKDTHRLIHLYPCQYDVGVDNNDLRPVSFYQIKSVIEKQIEEARKNVIIPWGFKMAEPEKIIFINPEDTLAPSDKAFNPDAVERLRRLIETTGAEIVVTSPWAKMERGNVAAIWRERNMPGDIYDVTKPASCLKDEVTNWLALYCGPVRFIVLDGDRWCDYDERLIGVDPGNGLTTDNVDKAIELLNNELRYFENLFDIVRLERILEQ